jgi:CHASE2 domain/CHAT domain
MKLVDSIYHLKVQRVGQICLFELSWGQGQGLAVQVAYPLALTQSYRAWQIAYRSFYQTAELRGRAVSGGDVSLPIDWHAELVKAETKLMYEFHRWLRHADLYDIRAKIAGASQKLAQSHPESPKALTVFLTCTPIELARFPWEVWELDAEFTTHSTGTIRIIRSSLNIEENSSSSAQQPLRSHRKTRILAILGDDTGLDFHADREAVRSLLTQAEVQFVGWQPHQKGSQVIRQITQAIDDPQGWDILFFAGHSNETAMTGGELGVAPGVSLAICEIMPQLVAAKQRGLQVAIFNSCSGLSIADALVGIGFSQVVVMREPIQNRVAQEFLVHFLQGLSNHLDVHQSMILARQHLRLEKSQTYPSTFLVPSLFCHPQAQLFRIPKFGLKQQLRKILPLRQEAIAIVLCTVLSSIPLVQQTLLDGRVFLQSIYRGATGQVASTRPPVALVQIDQESIDRSRIQDFSYSPLDRSYLAKLLERSQALKAPIVGLDVLLDSHKTGDDALGKAVQSAISRQAWLQFAADIEPQQEAGVSEASGIANQNWSLQGYVNNYSKTSVMLPEYDQDCYGSCPFAYLLALTYSARQEISGLPPIQLQNQTDLKTELLQSIDRQTSKSKTLETLRQQRLTFITAYLPWFLPTPWLLPLIDFSIPSDQAYQVIPAWKLLDPAYAAEFPDLSQQIMLIAAGDDERFGKIPGEGDRIKAPLAIAYQNGQAWFTGGESLAYTIHHLLNQRLVIPIPDSWMILIAALLGKSIALGLTQTRRKFSSGASSMVLLSSTLGWVGITLQIYISAALLIPWLLPSVVFWVYVLPVVRKDNASLT